MCAISAAPALHREGDTLHVLQLRGTPACTDPGCGGVRSGAGTREGAGSGGAWWHRGVRALRGPLGDMGGDDVGLSHRP